MSNRHGTRPDTPYTEPAPTVTGKARSDEWVLDRRQGGAPPRTMDEPAHTQSSSGLSHGRDIWQRRNSGPGAEREPRAADGAPSYTIRANGSGSAPAGVEWVESEDGCDDPKNLKGEDWPDRRPATVIAGDPRVFQPGGHHGKGEQSQNAVRVTVEEASVLQSFPPDYPWQGSRSKQFQQIGNAVPVGLARAILAALLGRDQ